MNRRAIGIDLFGSFRVELCYVPPAPSDWRALPLLFRRRCRTFSHVSWNRWSSISETGAGIANDPPFCCDDDYVYSYSYSYSDS